ncbi:MAG: response regulator [Methylotenera sp.]|uniref:response regulator n=1 Tax=Methylotenera sp. TaxID=2051956 RepID=UPI002488D849|nr:response regulator [Methylotenera sp.]MDI1309651.1 response regulator [Methylotenera sp.]
MSVSSIRSARKFRQTVLLIDDQSTVLDIHAAILKSLKMDLKIVKMTDPVEALEWMQNKQVDLIITDFRMHQMDGMQFIQAIKNACNELCSSTMVVTAIKDQTTHQELIAAGASACLSKPAQTLELASIAKALLEKSRDHYSRPLLESK